MRRALGALTATLLVTVATKTAFAHQLEIDQLRVWVDPQGTLRAQLILDPELTRPSEPTIADDEARARLRAFAVANVTLLSDGAQCAATATARELYVLGGAAPGDVVMLQCSPAAPTLQLKVRLGVALPRLAVEAVGFTASNTAPDDPLTAVSMVTGGSELSFERHSAHAGPGDPHTPAPASALASVGKFSLLGIEHIIPGGLDHVLFVVGLTLRKSTVRALMWQLAAFTLAHTLTLFLATLGWVSVSPRWVEPLIALSIVVVALANLRPQATQHDLRRVGLCFGFGLIHGLGFAGALGQLGMPQQALIPALLGFNLGVELGQVAVASSALLLLQLARRVRNGLGIERSLAIVIAAAGLYLLVERLFPRR